MKISLAIFSKDEEYSQRLVTYLDDKYSQSGISLSRFTEKDSFLSFLRSSRVDVLLADIAFREELVDVGEQFSFQIVYLTEHPISLDEGEYQISKYQSGKVIYKEIERICARNNISISFGERGDAAFIFTFFSVGGGSGATTVAIAVAEYLARKHKTLYLTLSPFETNFGYLDSSDKGSFDEVIAALYNNRMSLEGMLKGNVCEADSGVFFYQTTVNPLDMASLEKEKINTLISSLKNMGMFEYIILDFSLDLSPEREERFLEVMQKSSQIVMVSDGTPMSKARFERIYLYFKYLEREKKVDLIQKSAIIYNKFRTKENIRGIRIDKNDIQDFGTLPYYQDMPARDIINDMRANLTMKVFDRG